MSKWIHTGGGWYKNEETKERIRGKKNLPQSDEKPFTTAVEVEEIETTELVCMSCNKVTAHTQQPLNSSEWSVHNCTKCGGKTRVSLK